MLPISRQAASPAKRLLRQGQSQIRKVHVAPSLSNINAETGVPGLFSPAAFRTAWIEKQKYITEKLSDAVVDTDNEARAPFHIVISAEMRSQDAHVFDLASLAFNNHLFFSNLRKEGVSETLEGSASDSAAYPGVSKELMARIQESYGSMANLRNSFVKAASKIEGQGFVFLSELPDKKLQVSHHLNAGSPFSVHRSQQNDMSGVVSHETNAAQQKIQEQIESGERNYNIALLALNLWQDAWIVDFGVDGRGKYIEQWWKAIDWAAVSQRLYRSSRT